jgi:hypothetical protein
LADLGVQLLDDRRALGLGRLGAEGLRGALDQLRFPGGDLVRMQLVMLRQLGDGLLAGDGRQRDLGLERGAVIPAGLSHALLLGDRSPSALSEQFYHLSRCSKKRDHL